MINYIYIHNLEDLNLSLKVNSKDFFVFSINFLNTFGIYYCSTLFKKLKKQFPNIQIALECNKNFGDAIIAIENNVNNIIIDTNANNIKYLKQIASVSNIFTNINNLKTFYINKF